MKKFPDFEQILIFVIVLSMIFLPLAVTKSAPAHAALSDCTNWESKPDKDCDGIANEWEDNIGPKQYVKTVNGVQKVVPLPAAVNWEHRDLLVEIDSMSPHTPTTTAIDLIKSKFNAFELLNPDGTFGVRIHYIRDDTIPHRNCINIFGDGDGDPTNDFNSIKTQWMGTNGERGGSLNSEFYQAKKDVYHYFLFIHTKCGSLEEQKSSGSGEGGLTGGGNDGVVSLGFPGWGNVISGHDTGSDEYKASAFMHELGHNFNLGHGGDEDLNCKPNYLSVMNYLFTFPTWVPGRVMDFSHDALASLDENSLVESQGIAGAPTIIGHSSTISHSGSHTKPVGTANSGVNYDWYTGDSDTNEIISSSIINFHTTACNLNNLRTIHGFDDVHHNVLIFGGTSGSWSNSTGDPISFGSGPADSGSASNSTVDSISFGSGPVTVADELTSDLKINSKSQLISLPTNVSEEDILNDPTLPPCDISVPGCQDFPCDKEDQVCRLDIGHDFTNSTLLTVDYGENKTHSEPDVTLTDVLHAISSKVLDINYYLQSLNTTSYIQENNASKQKQQLQLSLVNATDSAYSLINSGNTSEALVKITKLRSLVDGEDPAKQIIKSQDNAPLLQLIDDLIIALEKKE